MRTNPQEDEIDFNLQIYFLFQTLMCKKHNKSSHLPSGFFCNRQMTCQILLWLIILLGIVLRFKQYGADRSLWLDELFFAVNFLERDWMGLMRLPLDYSNSHVAPPGFMLLTFVIVKLFGLTEPVLRFLPLVCGIGSLFLFERLIMVILSPSARPIALFLFVLPVIYVFLAEGISSVRFNLGILSDKFSQKNLLKITLNTLVSISILTYVTQFPIYSTQYLQEIKPVLDHIKKHKHTADKLYVYHWAEPALRFYGGNYGLDYKNCVSINTIPQLDYTKEIDFYRKNNNQPVVPFEHQKCILGVSEYLDFANADVEKLRGHGRVWFVFSHISPEDWLQALEYLDGIGSRQDQIIKQGSSAFLYKL